MSRASHDALRDINVRIEQAITAEQREIFTTSPLDEYLLGVERDVRRRAEVIAARDEPSLERFLPMRGDGVLLSATDIDTYRSCPLKYKFARVFRIPQEPTIHQRFGIVVHQVLERYHAAGEELGPLTELHLLLDAVWRRSRLRRLRGGAPAAPEGDGRARPATTSARSPTRASRSGSSASSASSSARTWSAAASTASIGCPRASTS